MTRFKLYRNMYALWTLSIRIKIENQNIHIFYVLLGSLIQVDVAPVCHL